MSAGRALPASAALPARITLVAGTGRSGTTWLGKLFDASPEVLYKHEPDNWARVPFFAGLPSRIDPGPEAEGRRAAFQRALASACWTHCLHFHRPPDFPKTYLPPLLPALAGLGLRAAGRLGFGARLRLPLRPFVRGEPHLVWKSVISNLRLAFLHETFPEMRIVLILRHPGGYVSSWLRGAKHEGWSGFGARERLDDTIWPFPCPEHAVHAAAYQHGSDLERELIYWIVANETPLRALAGSPRLKVIVYEDLCAEPERHLRDLYDFCGLAFCETTRRFVAASTAEDDDAYHGVFKNPARVASRWREELAADQIETVERYLGSSMLADFWR